MRKLAPPVVAAALLTAGCSTLTPTEDPVYLRMTDIEARLMRIERIFENESLLQLASQFEQLRGETAALRGEIETLQFEAGGAATRQRDLYVDIDQRLQALEQSRGGGGFAPPPLAAAGEGGAGVTGAGPSASPPGSSQTAGPMGTDQQNYQAAFALIEARRYPEAGRAFADFLSAFSTSPLADNAQYWLGETYYVQGQFGEALAEFQKVVDGFPQSAKLPDAWLKIGYCQAELDNAEAARTALQETMRQFPNTTAARLASQRLERLSQ